MSRVCEGSMGGVDNQPLVSSLGLMCSLVFLLFCTLRPGDFLDTRVLRSHPLCRIAEPMIKKGPSGIVLAHLVVIGERRLV